MSSKHAEAVKNKIKLMNKYLETLKKSADPEMMAFFEDMLAILEDFNVRLELMEREVMPGQPFIDDSEVPHRLR